jgi:hypothetical protein
MARLGTTVGQLLQGAGRHAHRSSNRFVGPKEELRAGVAQRVSSVRRSKWSGYWGPADLVGALQPLPQMTHFCPHPHAPIAAQHWTGQRVR